MISRGIAQAKTVTGTIADLVLCKVEQRNVRRGSVVSPRNRPRPSLRRQARCFRQRNINRRRQAVLDEYRERAKQQLAPEFKVSHGDG
jgi:hypothetical protein